MPVGIEAWFAQVPPITRGWLACAVLTSLAVVCLHPARSAHSRSVFDADQRLSLVAMPNGDAPPTLL